MPELAKRLNSGFVPAAHHKKSPAEAGAPLRLGNCEGGN
jgi:hypothetical protein